MVTVDSHIVANIKKETQLFTKCPNQKYSSHNYTVFEQKNVIIYQDSLLYAGLSILWENVHAKAHFRHINNVATN